MAIVVDAVVLASLYSIMCIGLTLTYMTTKVPNFAYGSMVTVGAYVAFTLEFFYGLNPYVSAVLSFLLGGVVSVAIYLMALKPMIKRHSSLTALMIGTLAVDIFFIGIFGIYSDYLTKAFRITNSKLFTLIGEDFIYSGYQGVFFALPIILVAVTLAIHLVLTRTKFGIAMRATVENPRLAAVSGVNVQVIYLVSWFVAGGLGAVAGCLFVLHGAGTPSIGSTLIVIIFAGSVIGGFESIYGAILGGALVGASQIVLTLALAAILGSWVTSYTQGVPLIMLVVTLLIAPHGLTSLKLRRK